jgi:3-methyladenine DNA glycosylase Mpg
MQQLMDIPGSRKGRCSAAATAEPAPLKAELKLLPQQSPCYGKPETFAVLLRAQQFLKALETPQSDCLQSETWKTLLDHDALLCSIMQWSLDTTVDACLKGILFPRDKNLFVKVENFLNGMDHSRRIGISDAEISPPFMSQEKSLDRQQSSQQKL